MLRLNLNIYYTTLLFFNHHRSLSRSLSCWFHSLLLVCNLKFPILRSCHFRDRGVLYICADLFILLIGSGMNLQCFKSIILICYQRLSISFIVLFHLNLFICLTQLLHLSEFPMNAGPYILVLVSSEPGERRLSPSSSIFVLV